MDETVNQNTMSGMYAIISAIICVAIITTLSNDKIKNVLPHGESISAGSNSELVTIDKPLLIIQSAYLETNSNFTARDYIITANTNGSSDKSLIDEVKVYGTVETKEIGIQKITYVLSKNGVTTRKEATFVVG